MTPLRPRHALGVAVATLTLSTAIAATAHAGPRGGGPKTAAHTAITKKHKAKVRAFRKSVAYAGPTGRIVRIATSVPTVSGSSTESNTTWLEVGGGDRFRQVTKVSPDSLGSDELPVAELRYWGSPDYWALTEMYSVESRLAPLTRVQRVSRESRDVRIDALRFAVGAAAYRDGAPDGANVRGHQTYAVIKPPSEPDWVPASYRIVTTVLVSKSTDRPLRITVTSESEGFEDGVEDIIAWDELPTETDDAVLSERIPLSSKIQRQG